MKDYQRSQFGHQYKKVIPRELRLQGFTMKPCVHRGLAGDSVFAWSRYADKNIQPPLTGVKPLETGSLFSPENNGQTLRRHTSLERQNERH